MEISPTLMALLLLRCFFWGMAVGLFYDVNRILRIFFGASYSSRKFKPLHDLRLPILKRPLRYKSKSLSGVISAVVIFFGDLFTVLVGALGVMILSYSYNSGELRAFTFFGVIAGFFVYYNTFGRIVMLFSEVIAICIKYALLSIFIIIGYPFLIVGKNILILIGKTKFLCSFTLEKRIEKVYNVKEKVYFLEMAKNGFLKNKDV